MPEVLGVVAAVHAASVQESGVGVASQTVVVWHVRVTSVDAIVIRIITQLVDCAPGESGAVHTPHLHYQVFLYVHRVSGEGGFVEEVGEVRVVAVVEVVASHSIQSYKEPEVVPTQLVYLVGLVDSDYRPVLVGTIDRHAIPH